MRRDLPMREAADAKGEADPAAPSPVEPLARPAALVDVMVEQIEFLAGHAQGACPAGCLECARLKRVQRWLLAPFR